MSLPLAGEARGAEPRAVLDAGVLWTEFHGRLLGFVARRVRNTADADDIVQKIFLGIHRSLDGVRDGARMHAWLYQIARNAIVDHYRAPARRREVPSGGVADLETLPRPSEAADDTDDDLEAMAACLRPMIDRLPSAQRGALTLVELEGWTQARAARAEGLSISGMKARVQRGRARLKQMLLDCCETAAACGKCDPPRTPGVEMT